MTTLYFLYIIMNVISRGKWIERLCIDLEHLGCRQEALAVCLKGLQDPHIEVIPLMTSAAVR